MTKFFLLFSALGILSACAVDEARLQELREARDVRIVGGCRAWLRVPGRAEADADLGCRPAFERRPDCYRRRAADVGMEAAVLRLALDVLDGEETAARRAC